MTAIPYDRRTAEDYRAAREVPRAGLAAWREIIGKEARLAPGGTVLDVGAGTGAFASAFHEWFGVRVLAVEPAEAMRALIPSAEGIEVHDGRAESLPVPDGCADAAWLGSVVHHLSDPRAAARELRRTLKPGAPVLIRNVFPGRAARDLRVRYFPATERAISTYPSVEQICEAFAAAGFSRVALHSVPQESAPTLAAFADSIRRDADSKLRGITDEEFASGMADLRAAAEAGPAEPATSWMDLLVLA
ncbi:class I SAM-dependent methyltransferase [Streptomyces sp. NPDC050255]|uniref:class I SAM-dependent methyltransferase n=1 Tax=Streptomyces sp. NPDC050255 TaxID=3365606 RepID=UPI00379035F3